MKKVGAIIQARMSSTRLPGKVLMPLPQGGKTTALQHIIRRLKAAKSLDAIVVATTIYNDDDAIAKTSEAEGLKVFRGSKEDVLGRYYHAAEQYGFDVIVRITGDCPCVSPLLVDDVVAKYRSSGCDYASNTLVRSYPRGYDVEAFSFAALSRAYHEATDPYDREHVTPYIYKTNPDSFSLENVAAPRNLSMPEARVTLDTADDYALLSMVYENLYGGNPLFDAADVVALLRRWRS